MEEEDDIIDQNKRNRPDSPNSVKDDSDDDEYDTDIEPVEEEPVTTETILQQINMLIDNFLTSQLTPLEYTAQGMSNSMIFQINNHLSSLPMLIPLVPQRNRRDLVQSINNIVSSNKNNESNLIRILLILEKGINEESVRELENLFGGSSSN